MSLWDEPCFLWVHPLCARPAERPPGPVCLYDSEAPLYMVGRMGCTLSPSTSSPCVSRGWNRSPVVSVFDCVQVSRSEMHS